MVTYILNKRRGKMAEFQEFGPKKYLIEDDKRNKIAIEGSDGIYDWVGLTQLLFIEHYFDFAPYQIKGSRFIGVEMDNDIYAEAIHRNEEILDKKVFMVNDELFNYLLTKYTRQHHTKLSYVHADFCTSYIDQVKANFHYNIMKLAKLKCIADTFFLDFSFSRMGDFVEQYNSVRNTVFDAFNHTYTHRWAMPEAYHHEYCDTYPMVSIFLCLKRKPRK
jgi:hypothetical protein